MTKFSNKIKNPVLAHFWSIFPIFRAKNFHPENPAVTQNFTFISSTVPKFRKNQENTKTDRRTDGRMEEQKDRQTLFHRTLLPTAGGPTNGLEYCIHNYAPQTHNINCHNCKLALCLKLLCDLCPS